MCTSLERVIKEFSHEYGLDYVAPNEWGAWSYQLSDGSIIQIGENNEGYMYGYCNIMPLTPDTGPISESDIDLFRLLKLSYYLVSFGLPGVYFNSDDSHICLVSVKKKENIFSYDMKEFLESFTKSIDAVYTTFNLSK
ncbi:type III secretion system chaperone [Salmonella enterica]|nr:hypothetical protein [Salmonella enterica]EAZ5906736.1 type III secretion system chaperone [Salmonella enterica]EFV4530974.1 type III secretion system chaperone [Salmonella enterica]EFW6052999.1 type III secretion system chaperone [Salmonella enterica]EHE9227753.1 type III secretion system chaperone [Salmonella enterica]